MQALSKIMRMSVCARKLLPKLFQHFENFSWNDKKLCGLDWWAWDYLDLPYAEESRWIPKFKSFGMMIDSRLWALRPKTTEPHDGQHSIGGALSTDWFLLICWLSPFHFQQFPAQVQTKGAHAHLERCSDAWGPWWAASRWGHARPVAAAALSDEERSLKMS